MRFLLLLGIACAGHAMENGGTDERAQLLGARQNNTIQNTVQHCCDDHGGKLILCCAITCIGGLAGAGCWHAGCVSATKASRTVVLGVMQ